MGLTLSTASWSLILYFKVFLVKKRMINFSRDWILELATTIMSYYIIKLEDMSYFYPDNLYLYWSVHFNSNKYQASLNIYVSKAYSSAILQKVDLITSVGKTLFDLSSFWPNDLSPCDHCASNGGLMPNKNHSDDKCDVKRSFPGFLLQIFS